MSAERCPGCGKFAAALYYLWLGYDYPAPHFTRLCADCAP